MILSDAKVTSHGRKQLSEFSLRSRTTLIIMFARLDDIRLMFGPVCGTLTVRRSPDRISTGLNFVELEQPQDPHHSSSLRRT